jgi:hypothetical protein
MARHCNLPFDSPNWGPLVEAHANLTKRVGNRQLAARDLTKAMAREQLPSMRRQITMSLTLLANELGPPAPECILLSGMFWRDHKLESWSDRLFIVPSPRRGGTVNDVGRGFVFYYWKPAYSEIWPDISMLVESIQPAPNGPTRPAPIEGRNTNGTSTAVEEADTATIKGKAQRPQRKSLQREIAEAILQRLYPENARASGSTMRVCDQIQAEWDTACRARKLDPKKTVAAPSWHTVNQLLGRE